MTRAALAILVVFGLAACKDMSRQPRYDPYGKSALFADGKSLQAPPAGTMARDEPAWAAALRNRPPMTMALLRRGHERYDIFCAPCHDFAGDGNGTVPARGFPHPPNLHDPRLIQASSGYIVDVISRGHGVMYAYGDRVAPADRWAIAAYVRALQLAGDVAVDALDGSDRASLAEIEP